MFDKVDWSRIAAEGKQQQDAKLRDEFAKAALVGVLSSGMYDTKGASQCALESYELADAMLAARGKGGTQ